MQDQVATQKGAVAVHSNWELAKALAASSFVPTAYKDKPADCLIAIDMAERTGFAPMSVLQNLHVIHGKPGFSASYLIACINASGRFAGLLNLKTEDGATWAYAKGKDGEIYEGPRVTMEMARAEGWLGKPGSKWKTMPDVMMGYRAATFFARFFASDLTMGLHTVEENTDIGAQPTASKSIFEDVPAGPIIETPVVETPPTEPATETAPITATEAKEAADIAVAALDEMAQAPATTTAAAPQPEPVEEVSAETAEAVPTMEQKKAMHDLATKAGVIKANTWLVKVGLIEEGQSFRDMTGEAIDRCLKSPQAFLDEVAK